AAAAQQPPPPLPLPGAAPALPLPGAAAPAKPDKEKKDAAKKKDAAPPPPPLPGADASAQPAETAPPMLPLPGLEAPKPADASSHSRLGVEATRWFSGRWLARGEIDWRSSTQAYVPLHSATNSPVSVDENRFDIVATMGYDLGPAMLQNGRFEFTPMLGVQY